MSRASVESSLGHDSSLLSPSVVEAIVVSGREAAVGGYHRLERGLGSKGSPSPVCPADLSMIDGSRE